MAHAHANCRLACKCLSRSRHVESQQHHQGSIGGDQSRRWRSCRGHCRLQEHLCAVHRLALASAINVFKVMLAMLLHQLAYSPAKHDIQTAVVNVLSVRMTQVAESMQSPCGCLHAKENSDRWELCVLLRQAWLKNHLPPLSLAFLRMKILQSWLKVGQSFSRQEGRHIL